MTQNLFSSIPSKRGYVYSRSVSQYNEKYGAEYETDLVKSVGDIVRRQIRLPKK